MKISVTPFEEVIKAHLDDVAKKDKMFAKSYAKKNKNIENCCAYIKQQIQKAAKGQRGVGVLDEEVYNLALHYYDEDDVEPSASKVACSVTVGGSKEKETSEKPKRKTKAAVEVEIDKAPELDDDADEELIVDIPLF